MQILQQQRNAMQTKQYILYGQSSSHNSKYSSSTRVNSTYYCKIIMQREEYNAYSVSLLVWFVLSFFPSCT